VSGCLAVVATAAALFCSVLVAPALAAGASTTIVVTESGWLVKEFGQQKGDALEAKLAEIGEVVQLPGGTATPEEAKDFLRHFLSEEGIKAEDVRAIQIVGGPDEVPYFSLPFSNQDDPDTSVRTDDPYGDFSGDGVVDVPIARLPDGGSIALLERQLLSPSGQPTSGAYVLSMEQSLRLTDAKSIGKKYLGGPPALETSPPVCYLQVKRKPHTYNDSHDYTFLLLHGSDADTSLFWGEGDKKLASGRVYQPDAFRAQDASTRGTVFCRACYGALIETDTTPDSSIALHFLQSGARCFIGSTEVSYTGWDKSGAPVGGTMLADAFFSRVTRIDDPLGAFYAAKRSAAKQAKILSEPKSTWKAAHEYLYYGVLPADYWKGSSGSGTTTGDAATALVIDVSSSMSTDFQGEVKLTQAKDAAIDVSAIITGYGSLTKTGAQVAVSSFSDFATAVQPLSDDHDAIRQAVEALQTEQGTNIGAGIEDGIIQLDDAVPGSDKVMILLSDGVRTVGMTESEVLAGPVVEAKRKHIKIFTVGFGEVGDLAPDFLQEIADATGGEYQLADATSVANGVAGKFVFAQVSATQDVLAEHEGAVAQGETVEAGTFAVPDAGGDVQAVLLWPGSELTLDLTDPAGTKVGPGYPGYQQSTATGPAQIVIENAKAGTWTSSVYGQDVSMAEEPFYEIVSFKKVKRAAVVAGGGGASNSSGWIIVAVIVVLVGGVIAWLVYDATRRSPGRAAPVVAPPGPEPTAGAALVDRQGRRYPLRPGPNLVGRDVGNHVELLEPSVSRRHARLTVTAGGVEITDLGSTSGVLLNGRRVSTAIARDGDELGFGDIRVRLRLGARPSG